MGRGERLDQFMVREGLARSRSQAREAILRGAVRLNGVAASRAGQSVPDGAVVEAEDAPFASRAAHKLAAALDQFGYDVADRRALDVGASTGGFTDVLLRRGARCVLALDVGHGQMAPQIAADPRVEVRDGVNARHLTAADCPFAPEAVVCDVSFISLTLVLPAVLPLAAPSAWCAALVKPQFEVGREAIGKGGLVRDGAAVESALERVAASVRGLGFALDGIVPAAIAGGDGNREFVLGARRI